MSDEWMDAIRTHQYMAYVKILARINVMKQIGPGDATYEGEMQRLVSLKQRMGTVLREFDYWYGPDEIDERLPF